MHKARTAFTLIEVMIAVLIISVVIMALFEMQGNNSHFFSKFYKKIQINQISSFFISNKKYGFEEKSIYLDDLLSDFRVEDELRQKLKEIKIEIDYKHLDIMRMNHEEEEEENDIFTESEYDSQSDTGTVFEIGNTSFELDDTSSSIIRLRIQ